jgi:2-dehydropantoate 2-reductase
LGTFLAVKLAAAGNDVTVVCRGQRLQQVRTMGLQLEVAGRIETAAVTLSENVETIQNPDLAIIASKAASVAIISNALKPFDRSALLVLTVQNGVDAPYQVINDLPNSRIAAARVHGFFELVGNVVHHVGVEPSFAFGPVGNTQLEALRPLESAFFAADIAYSVHPDVLRLLWEKLVLASSIGGIGAMLNATVGEMRESPDDRALLTRAMHEVVDVANARGVLMQPNCVEETLAFLDTFPFEATSSLYRDIISGRPGEFYAMTGAIPRLASEAGVLVPVHEQVVAELQSRFAI